MKINYYKYKEQFLQQILNRKKPAVYIFSNYKSKIKVHQQNKNIFLKKQDLFLDLKEFKEKVSPDSKLIIREEKLTSIFYKLLTDKEKQNLKITDYFDVIEISSKFYNFFRKFEAYYPDKDLNELKQILYNNVDLKIWQKKKFSVFFKVRKRYLEYMDKKNYVDQDTAFSRANFTDNYFSNYEKVVFVNKINFNNKEKKLINFLENKNYDVELNLQLKKEDFSEKELKLTSVTLPEKKESNIKLFTVKESLMQLVNSFLQIKQENTEEKIDIFDCDFKSQNYHKYLNKNLVEVDKSRSFTETKIYKFLNYLKDILNTLDRRKGYLQLEIGEILKAANNDFFRDYYEISISDKRQILELKNNNYVYLTEDLLKSKNLFSYIKIFEDIKNLEKINSFADFRTFLDQLDLNKLNSMIFKNDLKIFYSSIHEIKTLSQMKIIDNWKNYFNNLAKGFLKFFLNYLRYKEIKEFENNDKNASFKISDFKSAAEIKRKNLAIINTSSDVLNQKDNNFILSNKQLNNLGLPKSEKDNLIEKYYFMRHILSSDNAYVFSKKNLEENISESAYMEELALKYNLKIQRPHYNNNHFNKVIEQVFYNDQNLRKGSGRNFPPNFKNEKLLMEKDDFLDYSSLSYYRFKRMKDCQYRYFLEFIIGIDKNDYEVAKQMNVMVFGSLVHKIFAEIMKDVNLNLELKNKNLDKITEKVLTKYDLKINNYFEKYYNEVLFEKVKESALFFLKEISRMKKSKTKEILTELSNKEWKEKSETVDDINIIFENKFTKFYLNGRVDLLLKNASENFIIDFKTGGKDTDQLDFYELMLYPDNNQIQVKKMIYNVIDEKFNTSYKSKEKFKSVIKEELNEFMKEREYTRIYKSRCENCPYYDICRVVLK